MYVPFWVSEAVRTRANDEATSTSFTSPKLMRYKRLLAAMAPSLQSRNVVVRPMKQEDAPSVAEIWRQGLSQTAESHGLFLGPLMQLSLAKYGQDAMKPTGDVGPNGMNLAKTWLAKDDRSMFVAACNSDDEHHQIVGCIGVKVGQDMEKKEPNSTIASVWRMSVDEQFRRQGIGLKLMTAAEDWAREHECTRIQLETTNKIAAQFYTSKAGYQEEPFPKERSIILHYLNIVKMYTKTLTVDKDDDDAS